MGKLRLLGMIKAILFDFDGTLSNRYKNAYHVFKDYLRKWFPDLEDLEYEAVLQDFVTYDVNGTTQVEYRIIPFVNKYKLPEAEFLADFKPFYYDYMWKYCALQDDTIEVLEKLYGKYKLAILSNGVSKSQHDKIDYVDINRYFDEIVVSGDIGINKPNKEIFEIMAERMGVKPEECIYVGDVFASDIIGAIRAKMVPVWIVSNHNITADYYKGYRINKLSELLDIVDSIQ